MRPRPAALPVGRDPANLGQPRPILGECRRISAHQSASRRISAHHGASRRITAHHGASRRISRATSLSRGGRARAACRAASAALPRRPATRPQCRTARGGALPVRQRGEGGVRTCTPREGGGTRLFGTKKFDLFVQQNNCPANWYEVCVCVATRCPFLCNPYGFVPTPLPHPNALF